MKIYIYIYKDNEQNDEKKSFNYLNRKKLKNVMN